MSFVISGYKPEKLFLFFEELSAIPRSSGKEEKIAAYLIEFANKRGLACHRDALHNVIIKKTGSRGKEKNPAVILQGHTDMVCEKEEDCEHNFDEQGLDLYVDNGMLKARGTTLGADNGAAVALMLTLLDDEKLSHPPLECVFTVQEETGLFGATKLDDGLLSGRTMINLDSEEDGIATVSCAGGMRVRLFKDTQWENVSGRGIEIKISGLSGGHSGMEIGADRANANVTMGRLLAYLAEERIYYRIAQINGGSKDNAIPRECEVKLLLDDPGNYDSAIVSLGASARELQEEIAGTDPNFKLELSPCQLTRAMSASTTVAISSLLFLGPNGVLNRDMTAGTPGGFVVSSVNMAVIHTAENGVSVTFSARSSVESLQRLTKSRLALYAGRFGFAMQVDSCYPGWRYSKESRLREIFCRCYKKQTGNELKSEAIHAGLECGIFMQKLPGLDVIAIGPSIYDCHTPQERLDLASCERIYLLLTEVLENL